MNNKTLHNLLGLKPYVEPEKPKVSVIVSGKARELFKVAAKSIEQNHNHEFSVSNFTITKYTLSTNFDIIPKKEHIKFIDSANPDSLRGCMIEELIVDLDTISANELDYIKACLYPAAKKITVIDNEEKE